MAKTTKRMVLRFPHLLVDQPIVYKLIKDYDLVMNILKAYVTPKEEGLLVLELSGEEKNYQAGMDYLKSIGVKVEPLNQDVRRNAQRCTDCGVCVTICPTGALVIEPLTRQVKFYDTKCIACELCIKACPVGAMEVHF